MARKGSECWWSTWLAHDHCRFTVRYYKPLRTLLVLISQAFFGERRIDKKQSCDGFLQELFASWEHSKDVLSAAFTEGKKPTANLEFLELYWKKTKKGFVNELSILAICNSMWYIYTNLRLSPLFFAWIIFPTFLSWSKEHGWMKSTSLLAGVHSKASFYATEAFRQQPRSKFL